MGGRLLRVREVIFGLLPVGLHGLRARLPVGGADLAVLAHVLEGLQDAERLVDGAADRRVVDRRVLDDAFGVDDEQAAQRDLAVLGQHVVLLGEVLAEILEERVREALDATLFSRFLGPGEMAELRVDGGAEHLGVELLELAEPVREREDLGRADEREIEGIEEQDDPLPPVVGEAVRLELAVEDALEGELGGLAADDLGHGNSPFAGLIFTESGEVCLPSENQFRPSLDKCRYPLILFYIESKLGITRSKEDSWLNLREPRRTRTSSTRSRARARRTGGISTSQTRRTSGAIRRSPATSATRPRARRGMRTGTWTIPSPRATPPRVCRSARRC